MDTIRETGATDGRGTGTEGSVSMLPGVAVGVMIAVIAFVLSFDALRLVFVSSGINPMLSWGGPLCVDGTILLCTWATWGFRKGHIRGRWYPWAGLVMFSLFSVTGNALHAWLNAGGRLPMWGAPAIMSIPPIALLYSTHLIVIIAGDRQDKLAKASAGTNTTMHAAWNPAPMPAPMPAPAARTTDRRGGAGPDDSGTGESEAEGGVADLFERLSFETEPDDGKTEPETAANPGQDRIQRPAKPVKTESPTTPATVEPARTDVMPPRESEPTPEKTAEEPTDTAQSMHANRATTARKTPEPEPEPEREPNPEAEHPEPETTPEAEQDGAPAKPSADKSTLRFDPEPWIEWARSVHAQGGRISAAAAAENGLARNLSAAKRRLRALRDVYPDLF
ncbi:hypothetical protein BW14_05905 [Bifidobacterium sp. UTBIF-68]|uniref:DUF2637 domain-containing protein n=1 Tax=Bifidobacterium sp. UTBIF-68 TaxID=1465262 RepID=UPI002158D1E2|nr:DUF2637 domain-containing protein [Bifidobacterium sp. UTBIF-68]TPF93344.1 hypothetical protein BW14_05905 [Bifidobacterium sp. UTBIF-68]